MRWNQMHLLVQYLLFLLIIISIVKPGGIIEKKLLPMENLMQKSIQYPWNQHDDMPFKWRINIVCW